MPSSERPNISRSRRRSSESILVPGFAVLCAIATTSGLAAWFISNPPAQESSAPTPPSTTPIRQAEAGRPSLPIDYFRVPIDTKLGMALREAANTPGSQLRRAIESFGTSSVSVNDCSSQMSKEKADSVNSYPGMLGIVDTDTHRGINVRDADGRVRGGLFEGGLVNWLAEINVKSIQGEVTTHIISPTPLTSSIGVAYLERVKNDIYLAERRRNSQSNMKIKGSPNSCKPVFEQVIR